jgi:SnoaL-like domain
MPTEARVRAFIAQVEALDHLGAIRDFYHDDATMEENLGQKRSGIDALLAGEAAALKNMGGAPATHCISYAISGDTVFINWRFEMGPGEPKRMLDEVAMQVWDGDRIRSERFYYDPAHIR